MVLTYAPVFSCKVFVDYGLFGKCTIMKFSLWSLPTKFLTCDKSTTTLHGKTVRRMGEIMVSLEFSVCYENELNFMCLVFYIGNCMSVRVSVCDSMSPCSPTPPTFA